MTHHIRPTGPTLNLFDFQIYEGILCGGCRPQSQGPVVSADSVNPVEDPNNTKGCCGGTSPNCRGCDRCGPRG